MLSSIGCADVAGIIVGLLCGVPAQSSHMPVAETQPVLLVSRSKPSTEDTHTHRGVETPPASVYRALGSKAARPCEAATLKQYASSDCWMTVQRHEGVGRKRERSGAAVSATTTTDFHRGCPLGQTGQHNATESRVHVVRAMFTGDVTGTVVWQRLRINAGRKRARLVQFPVSPLPPAPPTSSSTGSDLSRV